MRRDGRERVKNGNGRKVEGCEGREGRGRREEREGREGREGKRGTRNYIGEGMDGR